jgi:large subunit ribosomal protein L21e
LEFVGVSFWCLRKRIHVHVEHVMPSIRSRKIKNDQLKVEAKAKGEVISTKHKSEGPKPGFMVEGATLETITPTIRCCS